MESEAKTALLDSSLAAVSYLVKESKSSVSSEPSLLAIIAKDRSLSLIFKAISFIRLQAITLFRAFKAVQTSGALISAEPVR